MLFRSVGVDRQFPNISGPLDVGERYAFARGRRLSFAARPGGDPPGRTIDPPVVRAEPNRPEIVAVPERCREQNLIVLLRRPAARTPFQREKRQSTLLEYLRGARVDRRCAIQWRDPPIEIDTLLNIQISAYLLFILDAACGGTLSRPVRHHPSPPVADAQS